MDQPLLRMVALNLQKLQPPVAQDLEVSAKVPLAKGRGMRKLEAAVWLGWRQRAKDAKKSARKTDTDLALEVSELVGYDIGRGKVNHWLRGRNDPTVTEFIALCAALGSDPGQLLLNVRVAYQALPEASQAAQALLHQAPSPTYLDRDAKRLKAPKRSKKVSPQH